MEGVLEKITNWLKKLLIGGIRDNFGNVFDVFNADSDRAGQFLELAKKYTDFSVPITPMLHEFGDRILVHARKRSMVSGRRRLRFT